MGNLARPTNNIIVVENFLDDYDSLRKYCDVLDYKGVVSPSDGVFYPGVTGKVPETISDEVWRKIGLRFGKIKPGLIFFRLRMEGVEAPHQAHNDTLMGQYTLLLYMTRDEHLTDDASTTFVTHKETRMWENPRNQSEVDIWERDTNVPEAWEVTQTCDMKANRAVIFPAKKMHRAEPLEGFGTNEQNGRLVLSAFFEVAND